MAENKTKEEILMLLSRKMEEMPLNEELLRGCCAGSLGEDLQLSRSVISLYLNELFNEGRLIKVGLRPTSYLLKHELEKQGFAGLAAAYNSLAELNSEKKLESGADQIFQDLIGVHESLSYEIEQCKAAVSYPGSGLPVLLVGATGTGKSYIANLLFEYCQQKGLISHERKLVTVNCAEYANNSEFFLTNLFGYKKGSYTGADKDHAGLLALADEGMLFFDEIHSLAPECQEKLFLFMDQGIYHMVGDNHQYYSSHARFVFATTENPDQSLLKTLLRRIPITVRLPALKERPAYEKKQLIQKILKQESEKLGKPIQISSSAYQYLDNFEFTGNIGELKNCLQISVAKAHLKTPQQKAVIELHLSDLPAEIIKSYSDPQAIMDAQRKMLDLETIEPHWNPDSQYLMLFKSILNYVQQLHQGKIDNDVFYNCVDLMIEQFIGFLFYDKQQKTSIREDIASSILGNVNTLFFRKYQRDGLSNNEIAILTKYIVSLLENGTIPPAELRRNQELFYQLEDKLRTEDAKEYAIAQDLAVLIENSLNTSSFGRFETIVLYFFLRHFHLEMQGGRIPVIILAHGYNIASGIAELANQLLHHNIFTAIDMPIESHFEMMTAKLKEVIQKMQGVKEVIVMVDMGSLEEFHNYIENFSDTDVGIINNVTTKLALDVGSMIMNEVPMMKILEEAKRRSEPNFVFLRRRKRRQAILTACVSGYGIACKFATLLENSFPKKLDLDIIPVAAESLDFKNGTGVLDNYDVLMMIGTLESENPNIPFISVEEIINQANGEKLARLFDGLMNQEELRIFGQNMIKNFSLDNLLNYLTILNPEKVITMVEEVLSQMQKQLDSEFTSSQLVGLYLHICCMIERLILGRPLAYETRNPQFEATHQPFIALIRKIFDPVIKIYNLTLPVEEIEYIHDYIYPKESVEEKKKSVEEEQEKLKILMEEIGFSE
ncbi:sigma 54-interacting transcriptional regulator [Holdemania massiliensis]|uniref:sigma 54-interacting transcriptional regulator n=1 Tax=Holdemania massiliensis TaxID=1468449 RepID=UPI001F064BB7|nr:sigma 54-interacting transcriptional regulator [Holdemania massiliensis]MCH1939818.1 sigma 54-interacting transcriptional regulator [Holdemania massiliensis]